MLYIYDEILKSSEPPRVVLAFVSSLYVYKYVRERWFLQCSLFEKFDMKYVLETRSHSLSIHERKNIYDSSYNSELARAKIN